MPEESEEESEFAGKTMDEIRRMIHSEGSKDHEESRGIPVEFDEHGNLIFPKSREDRAGLKVDQETEEGREAAESPEGEGPWPPGFWTLMDPASRAFIAVGDLARRIRKSGDADEAGVLLRIIREAIFALNIAPGSKEWQKTAAEWPSFVPGGPCGTMAPKNCGPLWRGWWKTFSNRQIGKDNPNILKKGESDFSAMKPANLAKMCFDALEKFRIEGPDSVLNEMAAAGCIKEPNYVNKARSLLPLHSDTCKNWRNVSIEMMEELGVDFLQIAIAMNREQTVLTLARNMAVQAGASTKDLIDLNVADLTEDQLKSAAKSAVSGGLLTGFKNILPS